MLEHDVSRFVNDVPYDVVGRSSLYAYVRSALQMTRSALMGALDGSWKLTPVARLPSSDNVISLMGELN
jgi:hypothetical protein